ncbi:hypothetical protein SFRURICE_005427 [Spodoptera frugiperda]|nr:hypothetical protein SFRURICE_005427 [Spodoptera frugiperda]
MSSKDILEGVLECLAARPDLQDAFLSRLQALLGDLGLSPKPQCPPPPTAPAPLINKRDPRSRPRSGSPPGRSSSKSRSRSRTPPRFRDTPSPRHRSDTPPPRQFPSPRRLPSPPVRPLSPTGSLTSPSPSSDELSSSDDLWKKSSSSTLASKAKKASSPPVERPASPMAVCPSPPASQASQTPPTSDAPQAPSASQSSLAPASSSPPSTSQSSQSAPTRKQPPPPPVFVHDRTLWTEVSKACAEKRIAYTHARAVEQGIKVVVPTTQDFRALTALLIGRKVPYHTYSLKEDRPPLESPKHPAAFPGNEAGPLRFHVLHDKSKVIFLENVRCPAYCILGHTSMPINKLRSRENHA